MTIKVSSIFLARSIAIDSNAIISFSNSYELVRCVLLALFVRKEGCKNEDNTGGGTYSHSIAEV